MSNQARVGLFTLIGLLALFLAFYVLANLGTRRGYQIGVHFHNVAGLKEGGYVMQQGVVVGSVGDVRLLPDYTVEVILNIAKDVNIPSNAEFIIQSPITGEPYLNIRLPRKPARPPAAPLPREILPLAQQPQGRIPITLADLLSTGQNEATRVDRMLADIERREPEILNDLQSSARSVAMLTRQTAAAFGNLSTRSNAIALQLQQSLGTISGNLVDVSYTLRRTVDSKTPQFGRIVDNLTSISKSLAESADNVQKLAGDPKIHQNVVQTTTELRDTAASIAAIAADLQHVTGDPQTQAQLKNTVANLDAATQRINSMLAKFGGTSSVYGVDAGATPAPVGSPQAQAPEKPAPAAQSAPAPRLPARRTSRAQFPSGLVGVQIRVSELSHTDRTSFGTPLLSQDQGPQSDVNLWLLPNGPTSFELGGNDFGGYTTLNAAVFKRTSPGLRVGGGLFYSRLGAAASADAGPLGLDALIYDLRHPTFDVYGRVRLTRSVDGFIGERDLLHDDRRTVFGLELNL